MILFFTSFTNRFSNGSSPSNSSVSNINLPIAKVESNLSSQQCQLQTSTESLADYQPAAPEVVLPQRSSRMVKLADISDEGKKCDISIKSKESVDLKDLESKPSTQSKEKEPSVSLSCVPSAALNVVGEMEHAGDKFLKVS